jgi:hypothetical protein
MRSFRLSRGRGGPGPGPELIRVGFLALAIASPVIAAVEHRIFLAVMALLPAAFLLLALRRRLPPGFRPVLAAGIGAFHFAAGVWVAIVFRGNGVDVPDWLLALIAAAGAMWLVVAWVARQRGGVGQPRKNRDGS